MLFPEPQFCTFLIEYNCCVENVFLSLAQ